MISFDNHYNALKIVRQARALKFRGPILVRADDDAQLNLLLDAGATEVIPETLEAGLMLATQLLLALGLPADKILRLTQTAHQRRYRLLRQSGAVAGD